MKATVLSQAGVVLVGSRADHSLKPKLCPGSTHASVLETREKALFLKACQYLWSLRLSLCDSERSCTSVHTFRLQLPPSLVLLTQPYQCFVKLAVEKLLALTYPYEVSVDSTM